MPVQTPEEATRASCVSAWNCYNSRHPFEFSLSILSNARSFLVAIPLVSFRSKGEGPRDRRLDVYRVGSNLSRFRCCSSPVGLGFDRGCSSMVCFLGKAKAMAALGNSFFWPLSRPPSGVFLPAPTARPGRLVLESATGTSSPLLGGGATGLLLQGRRVGCGSCGIAWRLNLAWPSLGDGGH